MRRTVLTLAGLVMATGASLALAGPASAAPAYHHHHKCHHHYNNSWDGDFNYRYSQQNYGVNLFNGFAGPLI